MKQILIAVITIVALSGVTQAALATDVLPVMVHIADKNFEMGKYPVTQDQWKMLVGMMCMNSF